MLTEAHRNKRYLIIGLGLTGLSCARFCKKHGLDFTLCDTRSELPGLTAIRTEFPANDIHLGEFTTDLLCQYDELLVSPGISVQTQVFREAEARGVTVSGDIQLFHEVAERPVIAITGSNGKSTVTTLVNELINASGKQAVAGGNLGTPALELLEQEKNTDFYVLELSSFQLETTRNLGAQVAVILNVSPDHMDRYDGMDGYQAAKQRIFQGAQTIVVNRDDEQSLPQQSASAPQRSFGLDTAAESEFGTLEKDGALWLARGEDALVPASDLKIRGGHNIANALAALAIIDALGMDVRRCLSALVNYPGLAHRCQWISRISGVDYFNDSKGTNVGSTVAAVKGLSHGLAGRIWLIAGGEGKGQDFLELAEVCEKHPVAEVLLFGADRKKIQGDLAGRAETSLYETLDEAVEYAAEHAVAGDIVLLSPACASFDQFRNYVHRGEHYCQCVEGLE